MGFGNTTDIAQMTPNLNYTLALGDSSYGDTFCGGGEQLRELFAELGVEEVQPMLRLDASETVTPETDAEPWLAEFIGKLRG